MQDFTNYFRAVYAADAGYSVKDCISLDSDFGAKVAQLVGHLSRSSVAVIGRELFKNNDARRLDRPVDYFLESRVRNARFPSHLKPCSLASF